MTAGRTVKSLSQDWGSPQKYVDAVRQVFGGEIDLDPCSNVTSIVKARVEYCLPEHDGLTLPWKGRRIYVNPPYGYDRSRGTRISDWLAKCVKAHDEDGVQVLALVPVATNTGHWKKYVWGRATAITFLWDTRLRFLIKGKNQGKGAPTACAMLYWGEDYECFYKVFCRFGTVIDGRSLRRGNNLESNDECIRYL
jgi:hypothetical protein